MAYENLKAQIAEYNKLCDEKSAKTPERQNLKYNRVYTPVDIEGFDYERDLGMPGEYPLHSWRTTYYVPWSFLDNAYVCRLRYSRRI